jgi:hypothetical protein
MQKIPQQIGPDMGFGKVQKPRSWAKNEFPDPLRARARARVIICQDCTKRKVKLSRQISGYCKNNIEGVF